MVDVVQRIKFQQCAQCVEHELAIPIGVHSYAAAALEIDYLDENGINKIRMFGFTGKHAIEANKKLELNFMLRKKAITKSGAEDWQLTLEEEVSVL